MKKLLTSALAITGTILVFCVALALRGGSRAAAPANDDASASRRVGGPSLVEATREPAPAPGFAFAPQRRLVYALDYTGSFLARSGDGDGSAPERTIRATGALALRGLAQREGESLVEVSFADARIAVEPANEEDTQHYAAQLERLALEGPVLARIDQSGSFRGVRFPAALPIAARNFARGLLLHMRHEIPEWSEGDWSAIERDLSSEHGSRYQLEQLGVGIWASSRNTQDARPRQRNAADELRPEIVASGASRAELDARIGAWRTLEAWDQVALRVPPLGVAIDSRSRLSLALEREEALTEDGEGSQWEGAWLALDEAEAEVVASSPVVPRFVHAVEFARAWSALGEEVLAQATLPEDALALLDELTALLERDPQQCRAAEALLRDLAVGPAVARMLAQALAQAGTPPAQLALATALRDVALDEPRRLQFLMAVFSVSEPTDELARAAADAGWGGAEEDFACTGMLALGAMCGRTESSRRGETLAALLELEAQSVARGTLGAWLDALGNACSVEASERALAYLADENEDVRASAARAVGADLEERHLLRLAELAVSDSAPRVRTACVDALARGWCGAGRSELLRLLREATDPELRALCRAQVEMRAGFDPEARAALAGT